MQTEIISSKIIPDHILWKSIDEVWTSAQKTIKPKPLISVSTWADEFRYLSPEDSKAAILGNNKWSHKGFKYLKAFEDSFNDPLVRRISVIKSAQTGMTSAMLNQIGWMINNAPGPALILYPVEGSAKKFCKRKLDPTIRDCPTLRDKISEASKRDGNNSTFEKTFPGGFLSILSAMSVNNLAQQSIQYLFIDEFDRIPMSSVMEGDTVDIIRKRLQGFLEISKEVDISTPTLASTSRIAAEYEASNKQKAYVPCAVCGEYQTLKFSNLKGWRKSKGVYVPEETYYECEHCGAHLTEKQKFVMLENIKWIAEKPEVYWHHGYFINELYSTLSTWQYIVEQFIAAKDNAYKLQTFLNTVLGEVFDDNTAEIPDSALMARAEDYNATKLPEGVLILTAAVDFQKDRAEVGIVGWGLGEESWWIDYQIFYGDPEQPYDPAQENNLYFRLEQYLDSKFEHNSGMYLRILSVGLDTGYATTSVQKFIKRMNRKGKHHIFALQGDKGQEGAPVINRGSINNKLRVKQFTVGTATAKNIIFSRLSIDEYTSGYIHFPNTLDEEFYKQLTSEKRVPHYEKGILIKHKWVKIRARNEVLDIMVYNLAALEFLNVNLTAVHRNFNAKLERLKEEKESSAENLELKKLANYQTSIQDQESSDQDLRKYRRPKKKLKLKRQNNFATNY